MRNIIESKEIKFDNLSSLRAWLNTFLEHELDDVFFTNDYLVVHWETEVLSDGSEVDNIRVSEESADG